MKNKYNMILSGSCGVAAFLSIHFLPELIPPFAPDFISFPILFLAPLVWLLYILRKWSDFPPKWIWFGLLVHYLIQYIFRNGLPIGWWWSTEGFGGFSGIYNMVVFPFIATAIQYCFIKIVVFFRRISHNKK